MYLIAPMQEAILTELTNFLELMQHAYAVSFSSRSQMRSLGSFSANFLLFFFYCVKTLPFHSRIGKYASEATYALSFFLRELLYQL